MKRIGVLTSGGDAPGMNAAVRAVVRTARHRGIEVMGIMRGYHGMIHNEVELMGARSVSNIIQHGGTIIKSARSKEFRNKSGRAKAIRTLREHGIDGLVLIGGDGTFTGAIKLLKEWDGKAVGVPGTIDNDLYGTDFTLGFDTAVNTALESIDKIRDTADAHERTFLVEVMGRQAGFIALEAAVAGGAEMALIPETRTTVKQVADRLARDKELGKTSSIIVVAEGDEQGGVVDIARQLRQQFQMDTRICVLGHIQRGGAPTAADRLLGSRLGAFAVELLCKGKSGVMAGEVNHKPIAVPFEHAIKRTKPIDKDLLRIADILAT